MISTVNDSGATSMICARKMSTSCLISLRVEGGGVHLDGGSSRKDPASSEMSLTLMTFTSLRSDHLLDDGVEPFTTVIREMPGSLEWPTVRLSML